MNLHTKRLPTTVRSERRLLTSMQRKGGERTRAKLEGKQVRIWSDQRCAWWRADCCGYTGDLDRAGIYPFHVAWESTRHCGPEKRIVFYVVSDAAKRWGLVDA